MLNRKKTSVRIICAIFSSLITFGISFGVVQRLNIALLIAGLHWAVGLLFALFYGKFRIVKSKPAVLFLTGLSGAGKTTLALALMKKLQQKGVTSVLLDGDEIRKVIKEDQFDEASRKKHNLNVGGMAALLEAQGHVVIVSLIAPYAETRAEIRSMCKNFKEVYVSTDLQVCIQRDTKGLYAKALRGEIKEFTGISAPYFPPQTPDLRIDTAELSIEDAVEKLYQLLRK
jgi:adenylyl-sulfate kinase